jgi:DNA-binding beta-propeller fold protein YncE
MKSRQLGIRRPTAGYLAFFLTLLLAGVGFSQTPGQFAPVLEWLTLDAINARFGLWNRSEGPLLPFELNTPDSQIRLVGAFYSNYQQSWFPAIDSTRGLLYIPEAEDPWNNNSGGSIAVVDLKTLTLVRRMVIESGTEQATPHSLALDPIGNRLFVTVANRFLQNRLWIADATSGSVQHTVPFDVTFLAHPYSAATNRLYGWWGGFRAAFNPANPGSLVEAMPLPETANDSYLVVNEASKIGYVGEQSNSDLPWSEGLVLPDSQVKAIDIDPESPSFNQVVWTASGSSTRTRGYFQPALDQVRQRLYVPDVKAHILRVFDARRGPTLHQELSPIPLDLSPDAGQVSNLTFVGWPPDRWETTIRWSVYPEVDPITGLIYAVVTSSVYEQNEYFNTNDRAHVVTIHPSLGVVGRAPLPPQVTRQSGQFIMLDPGTRRIIVGSGVYYGESALAILEDLRTSALTTPTSGTPVTVTAPEATITFDSVSGGGTTTIEPRSIAGLDVNLPGQFTIDGGLLYEVTTTATVAGSITLCFSAAHMNDPAGFEALHVLHAENGQWVDRTASRNFGTRTICAVTASLSPFAIAKLSSPAYAPRLLHSVDRSFRAGSTAPLKVQVLNWAGANISAASLRLRAVALNRSSSAAALAIEDSGNANPDSDFRYDADLQGYVFNLSTRSLAPGTYTLTADVGGRGHFIHLPLSIR